MVSDGIANMNEVPASSHHVPERAKAELENGEVIIFKPVLEGLLELVVFNYLNCVVQDKNGLLSAFPMTSVYDPLGLAPELWALIMLWVGRIHVASLETCGSTCRALYIASRSQHIYADISRMAQLPPKPNLSRAREIFLDGKRMHWDGFYACKQSYLRPGISDVGFIQPMHMVTFYRYIRFVHPFHSEYLICDQVLVLVTTESPLKAVEILRHPTKIDLNSAALLNCNVFSGQCKRSGDDLCLNLSDKQNRNYEMQLTVANRGLTMKCIRYRDLTDNWEFDVGDWNRFRLARVRSYFI